MPTQNVLPRITKLALLSVAIILVLMPFHATLTVWLSQFVGHYTLLRLWKELLLLILGGVAFYLAYSRPPIRRILLGSKLFWLISAFIALQLIWGVAAYILHQVTLTALGYGWIVDTRFLLFFLIVWVICLASPQLSRWWPKLVFIPAAIVVIFGLAQYVLLPYDFLWHLGYSAATIFPYEDINHNIHYIRIMSTLRGANPLGAYLVLVGSLLAAWGVVYSRQWLQARRYTYVLFYALSVIATLAALWLSFSRGAWIGLLASFAALAWLQRGRLQRHAVLVVGGIGAVIIVAIVVGAVLVRDTTLQNVLLHTQDDSAVTTTSDQGHISAFQNGATDLIHEPLGRGPGSAGPASVYNTGHPVRLAENFFIQIGQEVGWLGLLLFLDILLNVGRGLYARRSNLLALGLLAALVGLSCANLFSHAWADDTLAYLYWGLVGIAYAASPKQH